MTKGYLGIDNGTQGLSIIFTDEDLNVLATGEGVYTMVSGLAEGCYEQRTEDWDAALVSAMAQVRKQLTDSGIDLEVLSIGISGQMHGEVLADASGKALGPVRLWCDSRNEEEGKLLTEKLEFKMPKRSTASRFLWTVRNRPERAKATRHMTTPAGWISYRLTGQWMLGIGDAAGMFPIDQNTLDYDERLLERFDSLVDSSDIATLKTLLPQVRLAGQDAGVLDDTGAQLLGLPSGIPVAAAEGDQPAALAGSLIGDAGMVSMSYGTSVVSNSVGDRAFIGVSDAVDHFCAADGKPINMVWLRNGTTFMNTVVQTFASAFGQERSSGFAALMPKLIEADPDCGGLLALPFMDDEPGVNVSQGGTAMIIGLNSENATAGNVVKAALLSTTFNLKLGSEVLERQGYPRTEIILSGGLSKTPECGQIVADVFNTPVTLLESAEEGTAWGAALMAKFRHEKVVGSTKEWSQFLNGVSTEGRRHFLPSQESVRVYEGVYARYKRLIRLQPMLNDAVATA